MPADTGFIRIIPAVEAFVMGILLSNFIHGPEPQFLDGLITHQKSRLGPLSVETVTDEKIK